MNGRVHRAQTLEYIAGVRFQSIGGEVAAKDVEVEHAACLVPQFFQPNRRVRFPLSAQHRSRLAACDNTPPDANA